MSYNPNNINGAAAAASSAPVVLATEQTQDLFVIGAVAQSTLGNNILLASAGAAGFDTMAPGSNAPSYRAFALQIVASSGISTGAIIVEGSNDNTNWATIPIFSELISQYQINTAQTIAASTSTFYIGTINHRYLRCRISTAFVGGTVQAFTRLMVSAPPPRLVAVTQQTPTFLNVTNTPLTPTASTLTTANTTNATSVKNAAGMLFSAVLTNPIATAAYLKLYNKASAPTVGTDVPVAVFQIPASGEKILEFGALGLRFGTGIAYAVTAAAADSDTAAAVAGVHVFLAYA